MTAAQRNALEAALDEAGLSPVALVDDAVATLVGHLFTAGGIDAVHGAAGSYLVRPCVQSTGEFRGSLTQRGADRVLAAAIGH